jgi:hypothetical protein
MREVCGISLSFIQQIMASRAFRILQQKKQHQLLKRFIHIKILHYFDTFYLPPPENQFPVLRRMVSMLDALKAELSLAIEDCITSAHRRDGPWAEADNTKVAAKRQHEITRMLTMKQ